MTRERVFLSILVFLVVATVALQVAAPGVSPAPGPVPPAERLELVIQGQYVVGAGALFERFGASAQAAQLADSLDVLALEPAAAICLVPVYAELGAEERAEAILAGGGFEETEPESDAAAAARALRALRAPTGAPEGASADAAPGPPGEADREALERYCGYFAELAEAQASNDADALAAARSQAVRLAVAIFVVAFVGLGALALGSALAIFAWISYRRGKLRRGYLAGLAVAGIPAAGNPGAGIDHDGDPTNRLPYLEILVLFLLGLQVLGGLTAVLLDTGIGLWALLAQWAIVPVLFWPLYRGETRERLGAALGWRRPRSILAEIGWGLVAYVTAAPLLALGLLGSILASRFATAPPYHPILDWVRDGDGVAAMILVYVLAAVWAPVVEEAVFRGAFYHYLRGRLGVLVSALVVSLTFALIHPQGFVGVPFLVSLAVALAITREWRGSIVASMTMHALHNALAVTFLFVIAGGA